MKSGSSCLILLLLWLLFVFSLFRVVFFLLASSSLYTPPPFQTQYWKELFMFPNPGHLATPSLVSADLLALWAGMGLAAGKQCPGLGCHARAWLPVDSSEQHFQLRKSLVSNWISNKKINAVHVFWWNQCELISRYDPDSPSAARACSFLVGRVWSCSLEMMLWMWRNTTYGNERVL